MIQYSVSLDMQLSALERITDPERETAAWAALILARDPANMRHFIEADAARRLRQLHVAGASVIARIKCSQGSARSNCLQIGTIA